jgi:ketosteroid isomerase-like protein
MERSALARDTARAMSEENVERLKATFEAFNREDFDAATEIAHPEIEFVRAAGQPSVRGADALRAWMNPDAFEKQTQEPLGFRVNGNKVLVHQHSKMRGAGSGIDLEGEAWTVWTFDEDGRVVRIEAFLAHEGEQAVEAAGLSE